MIKSRNATKIKTLVAATFVLMVVVNTLANLLPINGVNTGQVSDSYQNLFAPAGLTFVIWGVIYFLLAAYTLYQLGLFQERNKSPKPELIEKVGLYFSISSIANAIWIFAWHYHLIFLSMVLIVLMLICLILIEKTIREAKLNSRDRIFIRLPFSVYFGWVTVATIANVTVLLVSWNWNGFGLSDSLWAVIIIAVGLVIALVTMVKNRDIAYGLVLIWAYLGILIKHTSSSGFAGGYPAVIVTVVLCMIIFILAEAYLIKGQTSRHIKTK